VQFLERAIIINPDAVRILITGYADLEILSEAVNRGHIYSYLSKPFRMIELNVMIKRAIESYELTQENKRLINELKEMNEKLEEKVTEKTKELQEINEKLQMLSITDELTQLYNFRYFRKLLVLEIDRVKRYKNPLALMMLDIDYFKYYNDKNGHLKGNDVLREVAGIIKSTVRKVDFPARYGGEEFSVILPSAMKDSALSIAERIRSSIEEHHFYNEEEQPNKNLTISIGIATAPEDAEEVDSLIEKADEALYEAKKQGRNRVIII
jgi:diguanylate cyclase (GGDEF)-like protein